jgi:hypothetical protein
MADRGREINFVQRGVRAGKGNVGWRHELMSTRLCRRPGAMTDAAMISIRVKNDNLVERIDGSSRGSFPRPGRYEKNDMQPATNSRRDSRLVCPRLNSHFPPHKSRTIRHRLTIPPISVSTNIVTVFP